MKSIISGAALIALFTSASAFAYDGYITRSVSLRAGPDSSYPRVAHLSAGSSVVIEGCVDDWTWCDVSAHHGRGWVSASYLQNEYHGSRVLVPQYGVQIGIPIVSFVFGSYWDDHYRSQSWYHQRQHYSEVSTRYYHPSGDSHVGSSPTYRAPSQAPVSPSRQTGTASQPAYHQKQATTTTTVAHAQPTPQPVAHQHKTTQPKPAVQHNAAESDSAPAQHQKPQQQHANVAAHSAPASHQTAAPPTQTPTHANPPTQQAKGNPKANDQAGGKGHGNGQTGGKNKEESGGGGKNENKDHGGG